MSPSIKRGLPLLILFMLPLVSMTLIPFYDTSEPRYAEIARIMAQSGDWITPWMSPGVPFWGKPPLSFWAQAWSMKAFGYTELAARLPSWICFLLSNAVLYFGIRILKGREVAFWVVVVHSSCALSYLSSGAVLTDPFLALGTTMVLIAFVVVVHHRSPVVDQAQNGESAPLPNTKPRAASFWQALFFVGVAIGVLAKGPLALVLNAAPILVWCMAQKRGFKSITHFNWVKGLLFLFILTLPWYLLAEIKTPGFLNYFLVGEHFHRFLDPGWTGDLYGTAHRRVHGTIWLFWLQATFPWGVVVLISVIAAKYSGRMRSALRTVLQDRWFSYWLAGALFAPVLFTFSANILWTYVLPAIAGFSVLAGSLFTEAVKRYSIGKSLLGLVTVITPAVVLAYTAVAWVNPDWRNTERELVRYVLNTDPNTPLYYFSKPPYSAQFYSSGKVEEISLPGLATLLSTDQPVFLAVPKEELKNIASVLGNSAQLVRTNKRYVLIKAAAAHG